MDNQTLFDIAYKGLASQGFRQSIDGNGDCLYRGPYGLKCAAGWLIPDDQYNADIEGPGLSLENSLARMLPCFQGVDIEFLTILQADHDGADTPEQMKRHLHNTAFEYKLTIPEIRQNG